MTFGRCFMENNVLIIACLLTCLYGVSLGYFTTFDKKENNKNCFCEVCKSLAHLTRLKLLTYFFIIQLEGSINDCSCQVDTVDHFNNLKIYPRLKSLLLKNYFRFYKVNLHRTCPFWPDDSKCAMRFCQVSSECDSIPQGLKDQSNFYMKPTAYKVSGNTFSPNHFVHAFKLLASDVLYQISCLLR